jgi:hypothetical protein
LWTVFHKFVRLLNGLCLKNQILAWQLRQMMPKRENVALTYLYFIPKSHKVNKLEILFRDFTILCLSIVIGRNITETDCIFNKYTNNLSMYI